jgi:hypothetical protein
MSTSVTISWKKENNHTVLIVSLRLENRHRVAKSDGDCLTFLALGASKGELQASTDTTYMKNTVKGQY